MSPYRAYQLGNFWHSAGTQRALSRHESMAGALQGVPAMHCCAVQIVMTRNHTLKLPCQPRLAMLTPNWEQGGSFT